MDRTAVIDASAVVELTLRPEGTQLAQRLASHELVAPAIIHPEATNVLRRVALAQRLSDRHADALFDALHALPIEIVDWTTLADRAWALRRNLTSYDAAYVALAELLHAPLITLDRRIAAAPGLRCEVDVYDTERR